MVNGVTSEVRNRSPLCIWREEIVNGVTSEVRNSGINRGGGEWDNFGIRSL